MPPRKRAASAQKPEPSETGAEPLVEDDDVETPESSDGDTGQQESAPAEPDDTPEPEKSDLQTVDEPCSACFPQGWHAQAFSVGCEHGTWTRESAG